MTRRAPLVAAMSATPDEVETQLYEALQRGDIDALMSLWCDDDEVACVHPGGPRAVGLGAIRASFSAIFANGGIPVQPEQVRRMQWHGAAVHHVVERITVPAEQGTQSAWVLATNVYVKGALGWRLAAHHASPGNAHELPTLGGDAPSTLH